MERWSSLRSINSAVVADAKYVESLMILGLGPLSGKLVNFIHRGARDAFGHDGARHSAYRNSPAEAKQPGTVAWAGTPLTCDALAAIVHAPSRRRLRTNDQLARRFTI
ncbi:hypothetical protein [Massilia sp. TSP1-1-2]|uniref:hypothetical protein n=1 Tax=Massilia sp. TSP1-1-2 TaxID=2804649 RepID=UPI003CF2B5F6